MYKCPRQGSADHAKTDYFSKLLDVLRFPTTTGTRTSSVMASIDRGQPGPTMLLRADMDAFEVDEDTGLEFASRVESKIRACGHDAHVAMLVGAARLLYARRNELRGRWC